MNSRKWVTFDCYGTLYDWQSGFRTILDDIAGPRASELVHAYHHAELEVEAAHPNSLYKDVLTRALKKAATSVGFDLMESDADALVRGWSRLPVFPDTAEALRALKEDGWRIGILTNCDDDLFTATAANFPVEIDLVVTAQRVRSYKPNLAHFTTFERLSGVEKDSWIHAAVSWHHDMQPARAMSIRRVWVDREHSGHDPAIVTAHIHDMASLPGTIRQLQLAR